MTGSVRVWLRVRKDTERLQRALRLSLNRTAGFKKRSMKIGLWIGLAQILGSSVVCRQLIY